MCVVGSKNMSMCATTTTDVVIIKRINGTRICVNTRSHKHIVELNDCSDVGSLRSALILYTICKTHRDIAAKPIGV